MNDPNNLPTPPPIELGQDDERALDALLIEALGPPGKQRDFTTDILPRLHQHQQAMDLKRAAVDPRSVRRAHSRLGLAAATVAVLAASVLAIVLYRSAAGRSIQIVQPGSDSEASAALHPQRLADARGPSSSDSVSPPREPDSAVPPREEPGRPSSAIDAAVVASNPPRRPPVVLSDGLAEPQRPADAGQPKATSQEDSLASESAPRSIAGDAELADFDRQFTTYWAAIGITPAPPMAQTPWLNRVADRFGWQSAGSSDHAVMAEAFSDSQACRALAQRLVDQLLVGLKPSQQRREQLVQEATEVILSGGRFDRWLSGWVADDAWLNDPSDARGHDPAVVGQWLASRVLGADVGCAKCHDSPIDSRYVQHDFWAVAALFSPPSGPQLFYELADGRQRVAAPGVPVRWFGLPARGERASRFASREELAGLMVGSPQVARTLANHLWTIGFGTPLVAAASSPLSPPRDDALDRALAMLGERLVSEDFDIRAVARWIIASDPMKRGVPEDLIDGRWQLAGEAELAAASLAQRSFAAAKAPLLKANRNQLFALMQSRSRLTPATLAAPDSLLAQPLTLDPQQPGSRRENQPGPSRTSSSEAKASGQQDYWWTQWLADREALRGGWLESIRDSDQQLRHAFYAAGERNIGPQPLQMAEMLLAGTQNTPQDRSDAIAQIHWILQHSK